MFFTGNAKLPQANWFFQRDSSICLRLFALDNEITHLPQAIGCRPSDSSVCLSLFLYHVLNRYVSWSDGVSTTWFFRPPKAFSRITYWRDTFLEAMEPRRIEFAIRLRLSLVSRIEGIRFLKLWNLDDLIFLSAWDFSCITYWRDTFLEAMNRRRLDFFVCLMLFCVSRIEGVRIRRGMGVRGRRCAATWDWRWQNEKRSRMRLSSGSLQFSRRHRGALCAV